MKTYYIILLIFALVFSDIEIAWAQAATLEPVAAVTQNVKPLAKWLFSTTETKLVFEDGREASLLLDVRKKVQVKTKAEFIENSCFPEMLPKSCVWDYEVGAYDIKFVWSKHPDVTKINQVVTIEGSSGGSKTKLLTTINDLSTSQILGNVTRNKPVMNPTLTCDSDNWLANLPKSAKQNALVPVWAFEIATNNPISRKNENQSIIQVNNIEIESVGKNKWRILIPAGAADVEKLIPVLNPNTMYYEKSSQECSIQIRIEKSAINAAGQADSSDVEKTYSFPLVKGIPKSFVFREVFQGARQLTREQSSGFTVKVE